MTIAGLGDGWGALSDVDLTTSYLLDTGFGHVWLARLALSLGLAGILFAARSSLFERNVPNCAAVIVSGLLLVVQAGAGHAAAAPDDLRAIVQAFYALHVLGAAAWIGGLWPLLATLASARNDAHQDTLVCFVLGRFGLMASFAVALVVVGGAVNAWPQLKQPSFSPGSLWSIMLTAKMLLFAMLLAIACLNRFRLGPRMASDPAGTKAQILRNVVLDQWLALAVLFAVAILGAVSPEGN
ncbi:putative copper resistance protein D [Rhodoblastus acidophilus]|uniref:Putative copper resistance protein D n=1 Tax=Rhodoblastus acidophilus TaxID=1074 RepID=A0A212S8Q7_RHOAC|nr:CopD family protein [Rhodoblastus acidophilus]SNB81751.1 putative copper resistance protein D [Rhodoblastus acidophilus]